MMKGNRGTKRRSMAWTVLQQVPVINATTLYRSPKCRESSEATQLREFARLKRKKYTD
jgi:hypothetical protein